MLGFRVIEQWRIQDCPEGGFVFLPQNSNDLFSRQLSHSSRCTSVLNLTPLNVSLLPQPPFSCHPRRFTSPNSAPSLQELLQKISLSLRGVVRTQRTPWIRPCILKDLCQRLVPSVKHRKNNKAPSLNYRTLKSVKRKHRIYRKRKDSIAASGHQSYTPVTSSEIVKQKNMLNALFCNTCFMIY